MKLYKVQKQADFKVKEQHAEPSAGCIKPARPAEVAPQNPPTPSPGCLRPPAPPKWLQSFGANPKPGL